MRAGNAQAQQGAHPANISRGLGWEQGCRGHVVAGRRSPSPGLTGSSHSAFRIISSFSAPSRRSRRIPHHPHSASQSQSSTAMMTHKTAAGLPKENGREQGYSRQDKEEATQCRWRFFVVSWPALGGGQLARHLHMLTFRVPAWIHLAPKLPPHSASNKRIE